MQIAILIGRAFLGLATFAHGAQKLFGLLGGPGIKGTTGFMKSLGFRPPKIWAILIALGETLAGLFVTLGLFFPYSPAAIIPMMIVAAVTVHLANGFFAQDGGVELTVAYVALALMLALLGPGFLSLDHLLGTAHPGKLLTGAIIVGSFLGAIPPLVMRRPPAPEEE